MINAFMRLTLAVGVVSVSALHNIVEKSTNTLTERTVFEATINSKSQSSLSQISLLLKMYLICVLNNKSFLDLKIFLATAQKSGN